MKNFIVENLTNYPLKRMCDVLGVSRKCVRHFLRCKGKKVYNIEKEKKIVKILEVYHDSKGTYGAPKIHMILKREGVNISRKTIQKYMRELNIRSITQQKFLSRKKAKKFTKNELKDLHNIVKDTEISDINQVWTQDITYIMTKKDGFVYLASVMDHYSKKVISYEVSKVMDTGLVLRVLKKALKIRRIGNGGLIIHSDKGAQYRAKIYKKFLAENHLTPSYTRLLYSCADNASQESFHSLLKKEFLFHKEIQDLDDAKLLVFEYIDTFYNTKRIHGALGYISPDEYEKRLAVFNPSEGLDFFCDFWYNMAIGIIL